MLFDGAGWLPPALVNALEPTWRWYEYMSSSLLRARNAAPVPATMATPSSAVPAPVFFDLVSAGFTAGAGAGLVFGALAEARVQETRSPSAQPLFHRSVAALLSTALQASLRQLRPSPAVQARSRISLARARLTSAPSPSS